MAVYLFDFREFIEENYKQELEINFIDLKQYIVENNKLVSLIHVDCKRSLWRFFPIFEQVMQKDLVMQYQKILQCVFERYVMDVWSNLEINMQKNYYQSVTDTLEMICGAFINFNQIVRAITEIKTCSQAEDYEFYFDDVQQFYNNNYTKAVKVGVTVMYQLYKQTQFAVLKMMDMSQQLHQLVIKQDVKINKLLSTTEEQDVIKTSYMQYIMSFCLHYTQDLALSALLTKTILRYDINGQMQLLAKIIIFCAQVYHPHLLGNSVTKQYPIIHQSIKKPEEVDAIDVLNNAVGFVMGNSINSPILQQFIEDLIKEKSMKQYQIDYSVIFK